jgi:hypothetical protein
MLIFWALGCTSIHSQAVHTLIGIETEKISQASTNAEEFVKSTDLAINAWKESVESLNAALQNQKKIESVHSLIFSSNQSIASKTNVDAHATGYLIGQLYLADRMGLEQVVLDQFNEDFTALKKLARQINHSWKALERTHKEVNSFSERSFLATMDANLMRSLIVEFGGDTEEIDLVLTRSREVNATLKKASKLGLMAGQETRRLQTGMGDIVDVLERIKNSNP